MFLRIRVFVLCAVIYGLAVSPPGGNAQDAKFLAANENIGERAGNNDTKLILVSILSKYIDPQDGISINELVERALKSNQDLEASRMEIEKARARLDQARLRPNPTLEFEHSSGAIIGSPGGGQFTVGASIPIEIYDRRGARINVAQIEIEASEAEVRNRERILAGSILEAYAEALGSLRELDAIESLLELDLKTVKFVQIRVNEGETPPLELNLLQAEVERLRSRRQLVEGRLDSGLTQIKLLAGLSFDEPLRMREQLDTAILPGLPPTREAAISIALNTRPDIRLTEIETQLATAGLRLVRATSRPDLTAYSRYTQGRLGFDNAEPGPFQSKNRSLTFGVAIGLPIFNKNQGLKAEAEISIRQAQSRREFAERVVRSEVLSAYQRYEAAGRAVNTLESSAIPLSTQNVETFRRVYELGEIKITDLIAEQRRLLDATRDLTEALTQRYRARVDLNIALGAGGLLPEKK